MSRGRVIVSQEPPIDPDGIPLAAVPDEPFDLDGRVVLAVIHDRGTMSAALDALQRGAILKLRVELSESETNEFLDQLRRIAVVTEPVATGQVTTDQLALLTELRNGSSIHAAGHAVGMSRRTATRRVAELRAVFGARSLADLLRRAEDGRGDGD